MLNRILVPLLVSSLIWAICVSTATAGQTGFVYAMTNSAQGNEIILYGRDSHGMLTMIEEVPTGGLGSGGDPPLEPVDALGAQGPLLLSQNYRWLFAVNAGSDEISVFRADSKGLVLTDKVSSNGQFPVSLSLHKDLLYVLNSGGDGNITGFRLSKQGTLTSLAGSTRSLGAGGTNPPFFLVSPAQVGFTPRGRQLVVTIKGSNEILVFSVGADGIPSPTPVINISQGSTPFGFTFDAQEHLIVVEPFGRENLGIPNAGAVSSYSIADDGSLSVVNPSVENFQTATCWIAITPNGRFAYATNNGSDTISGYSVRRDGSLSLLDADGVTAMSGFAPVDVAITPNGLFLYAVNAGAGTVSMFRINEADGSLTSLGEVGGLPADDGAVGIAAR